MSSLFTPRCRYCQGDIQETDKVCPHCGEKFPEDEPPIGVRTARAYRRGMYYGGGKPMTDKEFKESERKSSCFIATAAYGTPMAQEIVILREWRDQTLMKKRGGKKFINFYYKVSPCLAGIISKSNVLRKFVRFGLRPIIHHMERGH